MHICNFKRNTGIAVLRRRGLALSIHPDRHVSLSRLPGLHRNEGGLLFQIYDRRYFDARRAAVRKIKMFFRHDDQIHIPVQSAIKRKIRFLGINDIVIAVVHRNAELVPLPQMFRQFHPKRRISSLMHRQFFAVQAHPRRHRRAFDLQKYTTSCRRRRLFQFAYIPAASAEIVVAAVLPVRRVPCMGQIYLTTLIILIKLPVLIQ